MGRMSFDMNDAHTGVVHFAGVNAVAEVAEPGLTNNDHQE